MSISLEVLGDRWSLLIVRDLMVRGFQTFREFQESGEGIASNVLADRLRKLERAGILRTEPPGPDRRRIHYRLTEKGIDLAPVLVELLIWGARHESTGAGAVIEQMARERQGILAEVRRRWRERDPAPLQVRGKWVLPRRDESAGQSSESSGKPHGGRKLKEEGNACSAAVLAGVRPRDGGSEKDARAGAGG